MMLKEKRDMRAVMLKLGAVAVISVGGIIYTFLTTKRIKPSSSLDSDNQAGTSGDMNENFVLQRTPSSCSSSSVGPQKSDEASLAKSSSGSFSGGRFNGDKDSYLLPEFNEIVEDFNFASTKSGFSPGKGKEKIDSNGETAMENKVVQRGASEREIRTLKNVVKSLKERERNLEIKLLEYYGYKEQETAVMELQNRLKINNVEAKLFNLKIESLQADKRRLEALAADQAKASAELEAAKAKIKLLKKQLRSEAEQNKERILALQVRVMKLQEQENEKNPITEDLDIAAKLQKLKDLEEEADALRMSNSNLRVENSELAQQLEDVQLLETYVLEDAEKTSLKEEIQRLRQANESLTKEIDELQAGRCTEVEELVYLRWVNACLRYELRNYNPRPGRTIARDLSKTLSPKSEEKAKQLILEYATKEGLNESSTSPIDFDSDQWPSSPASYFTDHSEFDESSMDMSSANRTHTKGKVFGKLMRLLRGKDDHHHSQSSSAEISSCVEDMERRYSSDSNVLDSGAYTMNRRSRRSSRGSRYSSDEGALRIYRSIDSIAEDGNELTEANQIIQDSENFQKSELAKYAEVLKGSRKSSTRRRSAAFSSF